MNVVEKYGGTSVGTIAQIKAIAAHAAKLKAQGNQVVIVASAMGKTTNKLIAIDVYKRQGFHLYLYVFFLCRLT